MLWVMDSLSAFEILLWHKADEIKKQHWLKSDHKDQVEFNIKIEHKSQNIKNIAIHICEYAYLLL